MLEPQFVSSAYNHISFDPRKQDVEMEDHSGISNGEKSKGNSISNTAKIQKLTNDYLTPIFGKTQINYDLNNEAVETKSAPPDPNEDI